MLIDVQLKIYEFLLHVTFNYYRHWEQEVSLCYATREHSLRPWEPWIKYNAI